MTGATDGRHHQGSRQMNPAAQGCTLTAILRFARVLCDVADEVVRDLCGVFEPEVAPAAPGCPPSNTMGPRVDDGDADA